MDYDDNKSNVTIVYSNKVWFRCMDGDEIVKVDRRCRYESLRVDRLIKDGEENQKEKPERVDPLCINMMKDGKSGQFPYHVEITTKILLIVEEFCVNRFEIFRNNQFDDFDENYLSEELNKFDREFTQKFTLAHLFRLMDAAIELDVKSLLDATRNAIGERLKRISAKKLLKMVNLPVVSTLPDP